MLRETTGNEIENQEKFRNSTHNVAEYRTKFTNVNCNSSLQRLQNNFMLQTQQNQYALYDYLRCNLLKQNQSNLYFKETTQENKLSTLSFSSSGISETKTSAVTENYSTHPAYLQSGIGVSFQQPNQNFPFRSSPPFEEAPQFFTNHQSDFNFGYRNGRNESNNSNTNATTTCNMQTTFAVNNTNSSTATFCEPGNLLHNLESKNSTTNTKSILKKSSKYCITTPSLLQVCSDAQITKNTSKNRPSILNKRASETDLHSYEGMNECRFRKSNTEVDNTNKRWKSMNSSIYANGRVQTHPLVLEKNERESTNNIGSELLHTKKTTEGKDMMLEESTNGEVGKPMSEYDMNTNSSVHQHGEQTRNTINNNSSYSTENPENGRPPMRNTVDPPSMDMEDSLSRNSTDMNDKTSSYATNNSAGAPKGKTGKHSKGVEWGVVYYYRYNTGSRGANHFFNRHELKSFRDLAGILHRLGDVKNPNHHLIYQDEVIDSYLLQHSRHKNHKNLKNVSIEEEKGFPLLSENLNVSLEDYLYAVHDGKVFFCVELADDLDSLHPKNNSSISNINRNYYVEDLTFSMITEEMEEGILSDHEDNGMEEYVDIETMSDVDISEDDRSSATVSLEDSEDEIDVEDFLDERKEQHEKYKNEEKTGIMNLGKQYIHCFDENTHGGIFTPMSSPRNCNLSTDIKHRLSKIPSSEETVVEKYSNPQNTYEFVEEVCKKFSSSHRKKYRRTKKVFLRVLKTRQLAASALIPVKLMKVKSKQMKEAKIGRLAHQDSFQIQHRQNSSVYTIHN